MSDYLKTKALISSHVLRQKYFAENVKKHVCDFTAGTAIAGKPAISGTQSVDYSMVPLYSDAACTIPIGSATFYDMLLNIEDNYTINEKGIFSFTKRDASGKIINSPTVQYEYSLGSNSNDLFFSNPSSNTFRMDGYGMDGIHNLLNLSNVRLTINVSCNLRTVSFTGGNVANYSLLHEKKYYYTLDDFAYPGHPGRCNDYYYPARN